MTTLDEIAPNLATFSRDDPSISIPILLGYNHLSCQKFQIGKIENMCRLCNEKPEDLNHLVYECPTPALARLEVFNNFQSQSPMDLLRFAQVDHIGQALEASGTE